MDFLCLYFDIEYAQLNTWELKSHYKTVCCAPLAICQEMPIDHAPNIKSKVLPYKFSTGF